MKLSNNPERAHLREFRKVDLADGVQITVYSLPITFEMDFQREMSTPPEDDIQARREYDMLRMAGVIAMCVDSSEITFDTTRDDRTPEQYYRGLLAEITKFISIRQADKLGRVITELSTPTEQEVAAAEKDFSGTVA